MKAKLQAILAQLNAGLVEREQVLKTTLLAVLAGENPVLIGPPGTGKSLMARRMAEALAQDSSDYFEYLLTKFSTPEEIFGPLSISELKADRFKRNTAGYLPTVKLAFLDEIFKASSSILNALLTILNERIYHNGAQPQRVPLQALIAASNELPNDQEELSALYDRFLVRVFVDYVSEAGLPRLFETTTEPQWSTETQLQGHELQRIRETAHAVQLPPEIAQAIQRIWTLHRETFKEDRRESLSDRRLKKIIYLLRVSAATNGREEVDLSDVLLLKDCLWNHPDNAVKVRELVLKTLQGCSYEVPVNEVPLETGEAISATAPKTKRGKANAIVKGFKGSGTAEDPLLVETVEHLADLARPEVGQQGYHFRQTADLDCSKLGTWPQITFRGCYDGNGYSIKGKNGGKYPRFSAFDLFVKISESVITKLHLVDFYLANSTENHCTIIACQTDDYLINQSTDCIITACQTGGALISEEAINCKITACQADSSLIDGKAINCIITNCQADGTIVRDVADCCTISDCFISMNRKQITDKSGIVKSANNSTIERCFVAGFGKNSYSGLKGILIEFSGVAVACSGGSTIQYCALGNFLGKVNWQGRIAREVESGCTLKKNISIDTNPITPVSTNSTNINSTIGMFAGILQNNKKNQSTHEDGESVAAALFKQRYFENSLKWNFKSTWYWDDKSDHPALRSVGIAAANITTTDSKKSIAATLNKLTTDLLTQQIRANLWL